MKRTILAAAAMIAAAASVARGAGAPQGWEEAGEIRVASPALLKPQVDKLSVYIKYPLLYMTVAEELAGCECGRAFGAPAKDDGLQVKLYSDGRRLANVLFWPVAQGAAAWRKANPRRKVDGAKPYFTPDGRHACMCEEFPGLAKAAAKGAGGGKTLKKGILSLTLHNERFFDNAGPFVEELADAVSEITGETAGIPAGFRQTICAVAKTLKSVRAVAGVSKTGLDVRIHLSARDGEAARKAFLAQTAKLPAGIAALGAEVLEFKNGKPLGGRDSYAMKAGLAKAVPESACAANPAFAAMLEIAIAEDDGVPPAKAWIFCWRKDGGFHAIVRLPSDDLAALAAGIVRLLDGREEDKQ